MKTLLIRSEKEKNLGEKLMAHLMQEGIPFETIPVTGEEASIKNVENLFSVFFNKPGTENDAPPTHVAIFSTLVPAWIDFLAGFSCGSHVQLLICGEEAAKCIPNVFKFCFKFFDTEKDLLQYFSAEHETYRKIDADRGTNEAKDALLKMGTPISEKALANCVNDGSLREVLFFLAAGFSPDTRSATGVPLLNIAARNGDRQIIRFLQLAGAHLNEQAYDRGTSALLDSVMAKQYDLMMDLIKAGADVNIQSKDKQTALVVATGAGDARMVEALLKAGANPDIDDSMGMSARKYAALFYKNTLVPLFDTYAPKKDS